MEGVSRHEATKWPLAVQQRGVPFRLIKKNNKVRFVTWFYLFETILIVRIEKYGKGNLLLKTPAPPSNSVSQAEGKENGVLRHRGIYTLRYVN